MTSTPSVDDRPARLSVGVVGAGRVGVVLGRGARPGRSSGRRRLGGLRRVPPPGRRAAPRYAGAAAARGDRGRRAGAAHRAGRRPARPGRRAGRCRCVRPGQLLVHTSGRYGARRARPGHPARRPAARAAPGDDVHRAPRGPRPAGRCLLRRHRAGPAATDRARRWSSRWAATRSGSRRSSARSTTRRWRPARTTSPPWSTSRSTCSAGAASRSPSGCSHPLLGAALDNALRSGDAALTGPVARGDAGTVAAHVRELRAVSPDTAAAYVAMARLTADRALAAGLLKPAAAEALLDVLAGGTADDHSAGPHPRRSCAACSPTGPARSAS